MTLMNMAMVKTKNLLMKKIRIVLMINQGHMIIDQIIKLTKFIF